MIPHLCGQVPRSVCRKDPTRRLWSPPRVIVLFIMALAAVTPCRTGPMAEDGVQLPGLGPAFRIGGPPVYGPAVEGQQYAAVAFDGTNYMVVWADARVGLQTNYDIYAARVRPTGEILDPGGIVVSSAEGPQSYPAVAFDGGQYLVVWQDPGNGDSGQDIWGARVSRSGRVLDPDGFPISTRAGGQRRPCVAFDGTDYLVAWEDYRDRSSPSDIFGARVSGSGVVLDPDGFCVSNAPDAQSLPAAAFDGTNYLIVWEDDRGGDPGGKDIYGARVSPSGEVLDTSGVAISAAQRGQLWPSIAFDGVNYLVCWLDRRNEEYWKYTDLYCSRVSKEGLPLDPDGLLITTAETENLFPGVAFDGENYLVVWARSGNYWGPDPSLYGVRVTRQGMVQDPEAKLIASGAVLDFPPRIAFGRGNYLVVWGEGQRSNVLPETPCGGGDLHPDVFGAIVTTSGDAQIPGGAPLAVGPNWQQEPAAAFGDGEYMVVWTDWRGGWNNPDIYGTRVSPYGWPLDDEPFAVCVAPGLQTSPAIAYDGERYLVVWTDLERIWAARVTSEGVVLDPDRIAVSDSSYVARSPAVAFDGTNYLVVWWNTEWMFESPGIYSIVGARVTPSGEVLDPDGVDISSSWLRGLGCSILPSLVFNGSDYVVTWSRGVETGGAGHYTCGAPADIVTALISPAMRTNTGFSVSQGEPFYRSPSIASDGTNCMVVWNRRISQGVPLLHNVFAGRISVSGRPLDSEPRAVAPAASDQADPSVAFDGTHYVVSWRAERDDTGEAGCREIQAVRVDTDGVVLDSSVIRISGCGQDCGAPALCPGPEERTLIVYPCFAGSPDSPSCAIWGNMLNPKAAPPRPLVELAPNPFSTDVGIRYSLPGPTQVKISVYDAAGRLVRVLFHGEKGPGWHNASWNGRYDTGQSCPPGIYFIHLRSPYGEASRKCILTK